MQRTVVNEEIADPTNVRTPRESEGRGRPLHVLLLCHFYEGAAGTILEHIDSFSRYSGNTIHVLSNLGDLPEWLELDRFDAVIIHYSLIVSYDNYVSPTTRTKIRDFKGLKAVFIQDDYRWINDTVSALAYMRINALFPLVGPGIMDDIYPASKLPGIRRETVLTGYVPENLTALKVKPFSRRPIDVGYRARMLPAWMGSHTLQKWQIAEKFIADAKAYNLKVDISCREEDRIYGQGWVDFVANCKATLGTESGASVCDFTGDIQRNVEQHLTLDPNVTFEELRDLYFKEADGNILMNVISPRCFEAAALRTLMILYEGEYSGILKPWRHYVPLRTDHSNIREVIDVLRDPAQASEIIRQAYTEIALNPRYTYRAMVDLVDRVLQEEFNPTMLAAQPYTAEELLHLRRQTDAFITLPGEPARYAVKSLRTRSRLKFYRGHGLDKSVSGNPQQGYTAAREGQGFPQEFEIRLPNLQEVCHVALIWESVENRATEFSILLRKRRQVVLERSISNNRLQETHFEIPPTFAENILFSIREFHGQQRLLLRSVLVVSQGSHVRFVLSRLLRHAWHALPTLARDRFRPFVISIAKALRLI